MYVFYKRQEKGVTSRQVAIAHESKPSDLDFWIDRHVSDKHLSQRSS